MAENSSPEQLPLPMGVEEKSGMLLPPLDMRALGFREPTVDEVLQRGATRGGARLAVSDVDPNNLTDAGWGLIVSSTADPALVKALQPLIDLRRQQVRDKRLFRIFDGKAGYQAGETARNWLAKSDVGFAVVDPFMGVPLYLLIAGGPDEIPFEFQYLLDTYWNVGRLSFDCPADYATYASQVVAYEQASTLPHARNLAVVATKNPGDRATALLHDLLAAPLVQGSGSTLPLGERQDFKRQALLGEAATKQGISKLLAGKLPGGLPALLFSGSHGDFLDFNESAQRERLGAVICQDWAGGPVSPDMTFAAQDLSGIRLDGLVHLLFACYGGGCPEFDNFRDPTAPRRIAKQPFVARLPQRELLQGALAVLAHIDRAWSYSFLTGRSVPQVQEFRDVMVKIMKGDRVGQATDQFNLRWAVLSAEVADLERSRAVSPGEISDIVLANRWVARNDARNFLLFGDPAVRLRVESMQAGVS